MSEHFWREYQPGFRFAESARGTKAFFEEVTRQRYELEPHVPDVVRFERWEGARVLELGCGIGTDGAQFAAAGAEYTGVDSSPPALALAVRRFRTEGLIGRFVRGSGTQLPVRDAAFDLVFTHGVIHHISDVGATVRELHRILRPGGVLIVMVYHRHSVNYYFTIMVLRRILAGLLLVPRASGLVARLTGEPEDILAGHRRLLLAHGAHYLLDRQLFLSRNTDGPGNPLSRVYSRRELERLLAPSFQVVDTQVRYLNLRLYPGGNRLARTQVGRYLERRFGWHLYFEGRKVQEG